MSHIFTMCLGKDIGELYKGVSFCSASSDCECDGSSALQLKGSMRRNHILCGGCMAMVR